MRAPSEKSMRGSATCPSISTTVPAAPGSDHPSVESATPATVAITMGFFTRCRWWASRRTR